MGKRRDRLARRARDNVGQQMLIGEVGFGPGMFHGRPLLLMRCVADLHSELPYETITIGIADVDVDAFLVAVQQGVAAYKEHEAREGHAP